jgi:AcrR family transcriptional regulator
MSRWEPNAHGRLVQAALELFQERGYDRTTVQEIAERAGLTERTFFRYFSDKREVLFGGGAALQDLLAGTVAAAPATARPIDAVAAALDAAAAELEPLRERAVARRALVAAHAELRERELNKMTSLGAAIAEALRGRGVAEPAASLTAEAGIAVFKVAFERWIDDADRRPLSHHMRASLDELRAVVAGTGTASSPSTARAKKSKAPPAPEAPKRKSPRTRAEHEPMATASASRRKPAAPPRRRA